MAKHPDFFVFDRCARFIESIGIKVEVVSGATGFLNHIRIVTGSIQVDPLTDTVCGSMLHEAGHIAVTPSMFRPFLSDDVSTAAFTQMNAYLDAHPHAFGETEDPIARGILQSGESEAIAWSYAAAYEIGVDTFMPFKEGFDGEGNQVHQSITMSAYLGINGLVAGGMTRLRGPNAFPKMIRWTQV